jgi:hypothetical protein
VIRLDNNSEFTGNKLTIKDLELITESYSTASINAETSLSISAGRNLKFKFMATRKLKSEGLMMKPNYKKSKIKNHSIKKVPYTYVNGTFIGNLLLRILLLSS